MNLPDIVSIRVVFMNATRVRVKDATPFTDNNYVSVMTIWQYDNIEWIINIFLDVMIVFWPYNWLQKLPVQCLHKQFEEIVWSFDEITEYSLPNCTYW